MHLCMCKSKKCDMYVYTLHAYTPSIGILLYIILCMHTIILCMHTIILCMHTIHIANFKMLVSAHHFVTKSVNYYTEYLPYCKPSTDIRRREK